MLPDAKSNLILFLHNTIYHSSHSHLIIDLQNISNWFFPAGSEDDIE